MTQQNPGLTKRNKAELPIAQVTLYGPASRLPSSHTNRSGIVPPFAINNLTTHDSLREPG